MSAIIKMDNIGFYYRNGQDILKDFSYDFEQGKVYVITGQSGAGKTTLISLLGGLLTQKKGDILYDGKSISKMNKYYYRSHYISVVFQNYNLLPQLSAVENVMLSMHLSGEKVKKKRAKAKEYLAKLGVDEKEAKRPVLQLSGGQQQRVGIARAISYNASVIIADEPTGNLDEKNTSEIMDIFANLAHEENKCVIVVSHSSLVASKADLLIDLSKEGKQ